MRAPVVVRGARAALVFLTRLPVGGFPYTRNEWAWASAHFPFVGSVIGSVAALAHVFLFHRLGPFAAATLSVCAAVFVTGAFHEDALADTADALGGGRDREHVFTILKDPRVGAYGAVAITLSLLVRVSLIAAAASRAPLLLVAVHTAARLPAVWLLALLRYVTPQASSKSGAAAQSGALQTALASVWTTCTLALTTRPVDVVGILAAGIIVGVVCGRIFFKRVHGVTGDLLGSTVVVSECAMWLALVAIP